MKLHNTGKRTSYEPARVAATNLSHSVPKQ